MKIRLSYSLAGLLVIMSLLLSSCVIPGIEPATPTATSTPAASATPTPKPTSTPRPTATPNLAATQQVEDFTAKVQEYYDAGYISTTNGSYNQLDDFSYSWAKLNYYQWIDTDFSPTDFVLKSEIAWKSASSKADSSGCGFVFRIQDNYDHYAFFLSLKGVVEAATNVGGWNSLGIGTYGNPSQFGEAVVTLIVEGKMIRVFVNDKLIKTYTGYDGKLTRGGLAYTVVSGTNKNYGTSCDFKNTELWIIEQ